MGIRIWLCFPTTKTGLTGTIPADGRKAGAKLALEIKMIVEYTALGIGTLGTGLWALNKSQLGVSVLWLASAVLWIVFAQMNGHVGLAVRDVIGLCLYVIAIRTYLKLRPVSGKRSVTRPATVELSTYQDPDPNCPICKGRGTHQLRGPGTTGCGCRSSAEIPCGSPH